MCATSRCSCGSGTSHLQGDIQMRSELEETTDPILTDFETWQVVWAHDNIKYDYPSDYEQGRLEGFLEAVEIVKEYLDDQRA